MTSVLCQCDPYGCLNKAPTGAEAALRGSHDNQEVEALLLGAHRLGRIRSAIGSRPSE
jgi:hypothetical protein